MTDSSPLPGRAISRRMLLGAGAGAAATLALAGSPAFAQDIILPDPGGRLPVQPLGLWNGMLGVCIKTGNPDYAPVRGQLISAMQRMGVNWVRSAVETGSKNQVAFVRDLAAAGIQVNIVTGSPDGESAAKVLGWIKDSGMASDVYSVEGPNEWNLRGGAGWAAEDVAYQRDLWNRVQGDSALRHLRVLAPSLGMRKGYSEFGSHPDLMTHGNVHFYTGSYPQRLGFEEAVADERGVCGSDPVVVTETGFHNAMNDTNGHHATPLDVAGIYAPRVLGEWFPYTQRVAFFRMTDDPGDADLTNHEAHFGLLTADYKPKPIATALTNLNQVLTRTSTGGNVGAMAPRVVSGPADLKVISLKNPTNGHLFVLVWRQNAAIWDANKQVRLPCQPQAFTLDWGSKMQVRKFRPSTSPNVVATQATVQTKASVAAEMVIFEVAS